VWLSWREATQRALYGESGFYRRAGQPSRHFRTSAHVSPAYAAAFLRLACDVDVVLGHPDRFDVVDVGAGSGELVTRISVLAPADLRTRLRLTAVEVAPRPAGLSGEVVWSNVLPHSITGLAIANEWLDNVPVDVVEQTSAGPRLVLVDPSTGVQRTGGPPAGPDLAWLQRWWPMSETGGRAEIGRPRDVAWADLVRRLNAGVAVAADYAHFTHDRPASGTLTGYRNGRVVAPVPDGSCDITAHVALDSCASAGDVAGASTTLLVAQREALRALGVRGERPSAALAHSDPVRYLRALQSASEEGELLDPTGLGGFRWLVQTIGMSAPDVLRETAKR
jgi:SAM-dependent MidA family methyltransferase